MRAICLGPNTTGSNSNNPLPLNLDSFSGLFMIAWLSSSLALLIFAAMFLYQHWHILTRSDPNLSFWRRICILLQIYDQEDIRGHTIRQDGPQESVHGEAAVESSPSSPRPSLSHSSHTASNIIVLEMHEISSTGHGDRNPNGRTTQEIEWTNDKCTLDQKWQMYSSHWNLKVQAGFCETSSITANSLIIIYICKFLQSCSISWIADPPQRFKHGQVPYQLRLSLFLLLSLMTFLIMALRMLVTWVWSLILVPFPGRRPYPTSMPLMLSTILGCFYT